MNIFVAGAGAWGTVVADLLAEKVNNNVYLWCYEEEVKKDINLNRANERYLKGVKLNKNIKAVSEFEKISLCELIVMVTPSKYFLNTIKSMSRQISKKNRLLILTKGLDGEGNFLSLKINEILPEVKFGVLSGPNLAMEIAMKKPSSAVVASKDKTLCNIVQKLFHSDFFRVYTSRDYIGVQIGGAYKNILAIGAGISDGLGYGVNTKAAYLTRGLVEMTRYGVNLGAEPYTFMGLAGMGDLVATSFSSLSRNYSFGKEITRTKKTPINYYQEMEKAVEGVNTVKAVFNFFNNKKVELPIAKTVYNVVFNNYNIKSEVNNLMTREPKVELY
ncbi:MAG: NAD(P)H-dependent glycerol-3-phosphate dehydrogenase [Candidatus Muiribacteriota bacterium]